MNIFRRINNKLEEFFKSFIAENEKGLYYLFVIAILGTLIVFIISIVFNREGYGAWGDFIGGILNPILSFLTFMGLLITIILQQKELKEAREEFKRQSTALEKQQNEMEIQSFDNKFFQLLEVFHRVRLEVIKNNTFKELKEKLEQYIEQDYKENYDKGREKFSFFKNNFGKFNDDFDTSTKYYFLNLYQILKYIDDYLNSEEAKEYTNIIRAQLSKHELVLLTYNAIGVQKFTTNKYQELIEKYELLEHLTVANFCENSNIINIIKSVLSKYDKKAFGDNEKLINHANEFSI